MDVSYFFVMGVAALIWQTVLPCLIQTYSKLIETHRVL